MSKPRKQPEPEILNPRYAGATPDMVARTLLQPRPAEPDEPKTDDETPEHDD